MHIRVGVRLRKKKQITSAEFRIVEFGYPGDSFIATESKLNTAHTVVTAQDPKNKLLRFQLHTAIVIEQGSQQHAS